MGVSEEATALSLSFCVCVSLSVSVSISLILRKTHLRFSNPLHTSLSLSLSSTDTRYFFICEKTEEGKREIDASLVLLQTDKLTPYTMYAALSAVMSCAPTPSPSPIALSTYPTGQISISFEIDCFKLTAVYALTWTSCYSASIDPKACPDPDFRPSNKLSDVILTDPGCYGTLTLREYYIDPTNGGENTRFPSLSLSLPPSLPLSFPPFPAFLT
jgi:hypothetical protein